MIMLHNQPHSFRLGTGLLTHLEDERWLAFEAGVAWIRRSGTKHLLPPFIDFLKRGGEIRITVGVDIDNTSQEGLEDLLSLREYGQADIYIYHNEAGGIFHPKVYLLTNQIDAKLIVGSNNLTEPGLFVNVEACLEINTDVDDPVIIEARRVLASWRAPSSNLVLPLDERTLQDLVQEGYVLSESVLQIHRRKLRAQEQNTSRNAPKRTLFGRVAVTAPIVNRSSTATSGNIAKTPEALTIENTEEIVNVEDIGYTEKGNDDNQEDEYVGKVLIMRIRKAHSKTRPTQTQIPKRLREGYFFNNVDELISSHNGGSHRISGALARGIVNTYKVEIPEIRSLDNPVLRLERTTKGLVYQVHDASSTLGQQIMDELDSGLKTNPKTTEVSKPSDPDHSTIWRFI